MNYFLDTNSLIHFKMFSEINWLKELSSKNIDLIICPTVLQELDRMKFAELDIDIRNRCKKIIAKLSEYQNGSIVRNNVKIFFIEKEPKINWDIEGLSPNIPDDRILGSISEFVSDKDSVLISSDLGLKLKAKARNIKTHSLNDNLLIKVKKDDKEKELIKLKQKIIYLEKRLPKLSLKIIENESSSEFIKFSFDIVKPYDPTESDNIINQMKETLKYNPPKSDNNIYSGLLAQFSIPSDDEVVRYNKNVEKYLKDLKKYYHEVWNHKDIFSRIFEINLILINDGSEPAVDIDIFLHFPDGFEMFEKDGMPSKPQKPEEPARPRSLAEMTKSSLEYSFPSHLVNPIPLISARPATKLIAESNLANKTFILGCPIRELAINF